MRTSALVSIFSTLACGDQGYEASGGDYANGDAGAYGSAQQCFSSNDCPVGWTCTEFGTCEAPPAKVGDAGLPTPPEIERELGAPTSSLRYVYVAMPELDSLAKIDGETLAVTSVPVGDRPGLVVAVPGTDEALALDRGSATATIVRPTVDRDERVTLATLPRLNAVAVDSGGRYAVAWFDLTKAVSEAGGVGDLGEVGSFQDVTVLALRRGQERAVNLSVGFRPRSVVFDDAGARAFVITDDGLSIIDLGAATAGEAHVAATLPLADPLADPETLEVAITTDGTWAVVREAGQAELRFLDLVGGAMSTLELPAEPTDLDLAPSGTRAYAVLRDSAQLAIVDVPSGLELVDLGGVPVGSCVLDPTLRRALLFTNANSIERLVVVDLTGSEATATIRPVEKSIRALAFAPDGETALVLHAKRPGDPGEATSVDEFVDLSYGYSLFDLESGFAKLALTPVDPGSFAFAPDGSKGYVTLDGGDAEGAVARLQIIDLGSFVVSEMNLGGPPEAVGVLSDAGVTYVSQRHPLGRITFVNFATAAARTVTGFELNGHIVD